MQTASLPSTLRLTPEQEAIVSHEPTSSLVVVAGAGTGKTSTLVEYANRWPQHRGIYMAFNSDIAREAKTKFPRHVEVRTMHSFAYREMQVFDYKNQLQPGGIRRQQLRDAAAIALAPEEAYVPPAVLQRISWAFRRYLISDDPKLTHEHMPPVEGLPWEYPRIIKAAVKIVDHLMNFRQHGGPFNHDMYLKAYALEQQNDRTRPLQARYLALDESQDLSPVMIGIASRFDVPLIVVGDTYQSIYAFRGAVSAMETFEGPSLPLTKSWRFGPAIADAANRILELSNKPPKHPVRPNRNIHSTIHEGIANEGMILARTNARLMELLMHTVDRPFYISGGYHKFRREIQAGIDLWVGKPPHEASPLPYKDRDELELEAADGGDPVAARLVKLLEEHGPLALAAMLDRLVGFARDKRSEATLHLSTAHGAKGLEMATCTLLDDFWSLDRRVSYRDYLVDKKEWTAIKARDFDQELNLLYVAVTRAKERLFLPVELFYELAPGH